MLAHVGDLDQAQVISDHVLDQVLRGPKSSKYHFDDKLGIDISFGVISSAARDDPR